MLNVGDKAELVGKAIELVSMGRKVKRTEDWHRLRKRVNRLQRALDSGDNTAFKERLDLLLNILP